VSLNTEEVGRNDEHPVAQDTTLERGEKRATKKTKKKNISWSS